MQIIVKLLSGKKANIDIEPTDTIKRIKERVEEKVHLDLFCLLLGCGARRGDRVCAEAMSGDLELPHPFWAPSPDSVFAQPILYHVIVLSWEASVRGRRRRHSTALTPTVPAFLRLALPCLRLRLGRHYYILILVVLLCRGVRAVNRRRVFSTRSLCFPVRSFLFLFFCVCAPLFAPMFPNHPRSLSSIFFVYLFIERRTLFLDWFFALPLSDSAS